MDVILNEDMDLIQYALDKLSSLNDIYIYGDTNINNCPRAGTIAFNILGMDHGLVAAILNDYYNIAVRNECFCAHPYVQQMLQKTHEKELSECEFKDNHLSWKLESWMGMVRVSFGIYNDCSDVDALVIALSNIVENKEQFFNFYKLNDSGDYLHKDFNFSSKDFFSLTHVIDQDIVSQ